MKFNMSQEVSCIIETFSAHETSRAIAFNSMNLFQMNCHGSSKCERGMTVLNPTFVFLGFISRLLDVLSFDLRWFLLHCDIFLVYNVVALLRLIKIISRCWHCTHLKLF